MSTHTVLILLIIGLVAGMLSGLIGIGGGIVVVPALIFFLAFSQKTAQGTSLGLLLLPAGILGAMQYYKQGHMDIKVVVVLAIGFILGNLFGSKLALAISDEKLKKVFAVFIMLVAIKMLFFDKSKRLHEIDSENVKTETRDNK